MTRSPQKFRDFAERLVSPAVVKTKPSASMSPTFVTVFEQFRTSVAPIVGSLGFSAVLSRALAAANAEFAWLRTVHVKPDGSLEGLDGLEDKVDFKEIAEGGIVLLAEFFSLMVTLIGERCVLQLVRQAMPKVHENDLYFGEHNEREKK